MKNGKVNKITPAIFEVILIFSILFLITLCIAAFLFFQIQLKNIALDVKKANQEATMSRGDLSHIKEISDYLKKETESIERAKNIVVDSQSSQYEDRILNDISTYAQKSGVFLKGVDFQSTNPSPGGQGPATPQSAPVAVGGLKFSTATINIRSPVEYKNLMQFLYYIENNITKIQITGITITKASGSSQEVSINPLTIRVYVK